MASKKDKAIAALRGGRIASHLPEADARDLIEFFLAELDRASHRIEAAWHEGDAQTICDLAEQLQEAAAGYGFPEVTNLASHLRESLLTDESALSDAAEQIESLLLTCRRIAANED